MDRRRISNCCRKSKGIGDSIDGHLDEIVNDIKEDLNNIYDCDIDIISIFKIIQNGKEKHF